jgi:hypothetical protein
MARDFFGNLLPSDRKFFLEIKKVVLALSFDYLL